MQAESIRFDERSRVSTSEQPVPSGGALSALREAAFASGLDTAADLYNEALRHAHEGRLDVARDRLAVLLAVTPDDSDARLLLAKVHVASQRWPEALGALDDASRHGMDVPRGLREAVEEHMRADSEQADDTTSALRAREQGEIKALRQEARRLRSENAQLLGRCHDLERETRKWAWTTTAIAVVGMLFIAGNLLLTGLGGPADGAVAASPAEPGAIAAVADAPGAATPGAATTSAAPPKGVSTPTALAGKCQDALSAAPELDGLDLTVALTGTSAALSGDVMMFTQLKAAERALLSVSGVQKVDVRAVKVLARTKGATHEVQSGEILSKIAQRYYGDSKYAAKIEKANAGLSSSNLRIGQKIKIPPVE